MFNINDEILKSREMRIEMVSNLLDTYKKPVVVVKANVPGEIKNIEGSNLLVKYFAKQVENTLPIECRTSYTMSVDGNFYMLVIDSQNELEIKQKLIHLEESYLGRFIDLDLYFNSIKPTSRSILNYPKRKCYLCDDYAFVCGKEGRHNIQELINYFEKNVVDGIYNIILKYLREAMIEELDCHPKFGLVTKYSNGKHKDMNYDLFIKSIDALMPYFKEQLQESYKIGLDYVQDARNIGIRAEKAMFEATNGINTYKGANFLLGFLLADIHFVLRTDQEFREIPEKVKCTIKSYPVEKDFNINKENKTYGELVYEKYGLLGVRGIVMNGFSVIFDNFEELHSLSKYPQNERVQRMLCFFMKEIDDTTVMHKTMDINTLNYVKEVGKKCYNSIELVDFYTNEFIEKNISPGGAADLTLTTLFLIKIKENFMFSEDSMQQSFLM